MEALSFIAVSTIEYVGVLVAMLALFRYPVIYYKPQILFTSVICSVLSFALSVEHNIASAPLIQLGVQITCIWLMFYTPLLWSIIMCVSSFVVYILFQGGIIYLFYWFGFVPPILPKTGLETYLVQIGSAAVCLLLGLYWQRKRIGFLFIPTNRDVPFVWNKTGRWLFGGSVLSFFIIGIAYAVYTRTHFTWFPAMLGVYIVISVSLLLTLKRRNQEYVKKPGDH